MNQTLVCNAQEWEALALEWVPPKHSGSIYNYSGFSDQPSSFPCIVVTHQTSSEWGYDFDYEFVYPDSFA